MIFRLGFTGPRTGMTSAQMRAVHSYLSYILLVHDQDEGFVLEVHHGDCIGSDFAFHVIATVLRCRTVAHPPSSPGKRAWCQADEIRPEKDYLLRDWDIAREADELLATPQAPHHPGGSSGTWTTIGYAAQLNRPVTLLLPDGRRAGVPFVPARLP